MPQLTIEAGDESHTVPAIYQVCPRCQGHGHHDHPAFVNGISDEEFREDPDFRDDYLAGKHDVSCEECHGDRVVLVPNRDAIDPHVLARLDEHNQALAEMRATQAAERRMGA